MNAKPFPPPGLSCFWFLNDPCEPAHMDRMIEGFAGRGIGAVVLHARAGLLLPYGGGDWFAFVRRTARQCAARGVEVWLYDEDPYPSGAAGGRLVMEHPEFAAHHIAMFTSEGARPDGLFCLDRKSVV